MDGRSGGGATTLRSPPTSNDMIGIARNDCGIGYGPHSKYKIKSKYNKSTNNKRLAMEINRYSILYGKYQVQ